MNTRRSVLLLADDTRGQANTLHDHVASFRKYSRHRIYRFNPRGVRETRSLDMTSFDAVVIHYSIATTFDTYLSPSLREQIAAFRGLKVQFLQDEFRWIDAVTHMMAFLGTDVLFTVAPPQAAATLYAPLLPDVHLEYTIPGFVPEALENARSPALRERPIDVGYRGRTIPYSLGKLAQEKVQIGRGFLEHARGSDLVCDIAWSENDRIYGNRWNRFISSCKATLGTESGASIADFDGSLELRTREYLTSRPEASFEEVWADVLAPFEGNVVVNTISPRVLEAAALGSALVLFPGEYADAVVPWETYLPLTKDFSNFDEIVEALQNVDQLEVIARRARSELVDSGAYSHRRFIEHFDGVIDERAPVGARGASRTHLRAAVERATSTRSIAGRRVVRPRDALALWNVGAAALRDCPELRSLTRCFLEEKPVRKRIPLRRFVDDVARLHVLLRVSARNHPFETFEIVSTLGSDRTLLLRSVGADEPMTPDPRDVEAALRNGEFDSIVWDHSQVGLAVTATTWGGGPLGVPVGYHGRDGVYVFVVLSELARRRPAEAAAILHPLLNSSLRRS